MSENLHDLLKGDDPVALRRIERALKDCEIHNEIVDAVLSALIWRRCTAGHNGVLGAVLNLECASRISLLPQHLDRVGASDAAQAIRDLRNQIPLEDEQIEGGIIDWVDGNPSIVHHAATLDHDVDDVAPKLWSFMQERQDELPETEIPEKREGFLAAVFGGWQSFARQSSTTDR